MSKTNEELIQQFDKGKHPELDPDSAEVLETRRGPDDRISSRVPRHLTRALEIAVESGENIKKSDLIRKAIFDFLSENNRDALIEAKQEIEDIREQSEI